MTDTRIRDLERAARCGDPQARVRWVRTLVRSGQLPDPDLALAAYCGHVGARALLGADPPTRHLKPWFRGLARWGVRVCVQAAIQIARRGWRWRFRSDAYREVVWALGHWVECPCVDHVRHVEHTASVLWETPEPHAICWAAGAVHRDSDEAAALERWSAIVRDAEVDDGVRREVEVALLERLALPDLL